MNLLIYQIHTRLLKVIQTFQVNNTRTCINDRAWDNDDIVEKEKVEIELKQLRMENANMYELQAEKRALKSKIEDLARYRDGNFKIK